ncbi:DUF1798 family protein [Domibacillus iocasae]|uniref:DUF1798 domain-containing protein n=1 Tax=Domibacillus iocasae TaxID=1714016 RepID=A0A1E7DN89_9BACI|nr:DUF1798 family protein [Domibacillus iocasae]OES44519.1 hypothetical protein BA724_09615 [Domibacillus iocasae]
MSLRNQTATLRELIIRAKTIYKEHRESKEEADFFGTVKPFADEMDAAADLWEQEALLFLQEHPQKYVHAAQIVQAADNARRVGAYAHFFDTGKAKFIQSADSALYVLESLDNCIEE